MEGISDEAVKALDVDMKKSAPRERKKLTNRFQRIAAYGSRRCLPWFKQLADAEGLYQMSAPHSKHRFLLMPCPHVEETFILLHHFVKSQADTPPHEIATGLQRRKACLQVLEREKSE